MDQDTPVQEPVLCTCMLKECQRDAYNFCAGDAVEDALALLPRICTEHLPAALARISIADPLATCQSISSAGKIPNLSPKVVAHALGRLELPGVCVAVRESLSCFFQFTINAGNQDPVVHELHMILMVLSASDEKMRQ